MSRRGLEWPKCPIPSRSSIISLPRRELRLVFTCVFSVSKFMQTIKHGGVVENRTLALEEDGPLSGHHNLNIKGTKINFN